MKSRCLAWRDEFVSCNECPGVSGEDVASGSPAGTREGSWRLRPCAGTSTSRVGAGGESSASWQGSARSLGMLLDKRAGLGRGEEKSQLEAAWEFGLGWELFCYFGREPPCHASSCCEGRYPAGGVGSTGS